MDFQNVYSFEQRSTLAFDASQGNRIIIANRRDPNACWSNLNALSDSKGLFSSCAIKNWFFDYMSWLMCCLCDCFRCREDERSTKTSSDLERKFNRMHSGAIDQQLESTNFELGPFLSNEITTSKYTLLNFLPRNLFEQFRRLANFYFLTTAIIQTVIPFSPVGPATSLLPLLFVVSTTAIKQAYEDYLRHKLDRDVNNRLCSVLRNKKLQRIKSKDIQVGDIVHVRNNEEIPCDMILLASSVGVNARSVSPETGADSGSTGEHCYITTANLDGETSLKSRTCFAVRQQIGTIKEIDNTLMVIECEKPNATLYEFNGFLRAPKDTESYDRLVKELNAEMNATLRSSQSGSKQSQQRSQNVAQKQVGNQQKSLNSQPLENATSTLDDPTSSSDPSKRESIIKKIYSKIRRFKKSTRAARMAKITARQLKSLGAEQLMKGTIDFTEQKPLIEAQNHIEIPLDISNLLPRASRLRNTRFVYGLVVYTGQDTRLAHNSQVKPNKFSSLESRVNMYLLLAFLLLLSFTLVSTFMYRHPAPQTTGGGHSFIEILMAHFVLYNYLVPISLYVTLEFVKFLGTISVVDDKRLQVLVEKSENSKSRDNVKRIGHLDGKSNKKEMIGAQCNSSDLNEDLGQVEVLFSDKTGTLTENKMRFTACSIGSSLFRLVSKQLYEQPEGLCLLPVCQVSKKLATIRSNRYAALGHQFQARSSKGRSKSTISAATSMQRSGSSISSERLNLLPPEQRPFDHRITPPLGQLKLVDSLERNQKVVEFFICLCLCSTITLNEQTDLAKCLPDKVESYDLQSASPDEESLISAASMFGVVMCKSSDRECYIAIQRSRHKPKYMSPNLVARKSGAKSTPSCEDATGVFKPVVETANSTEGYIVRHFERLLVFEFNSNRKKMSVLYRDCDNNCLLMITKGSENVLDCIKMTPMNVETEQMIDSTLAHFEAFSKSGLRTMLVARKQVCKQEYEQIVEDQREARMMSAPADREQQLAAIARQAESNMQLVGATAVEDSLQEGVPETIANLKSAGIKVWLLTGDKVETAISVAYLCKLLDRGMSLLHLVRQHDSRDCKELLINYQTQLKAIFNGGEETNSYHHHNQASKSSIGSKKVASARNFQEHETKTSALDLADELPKFALIADGRSLHYAMKYCKKELAYVCKQCTCVLGCRLSPLQKAEIVDMIKKSEDKPICAAIGDGANDVSMIQEAHVGIGIRGKEGRQAVNSSDFALNRFHMLSRLFFVHGHLFYHRTATIIHYFFYKNLLFVLPQFFYSIFNSNEADSLYHPIMLISYNLIFTSAPILMFGLFEVNISKNLLEDHPKLYSINRQNRQMRYVAFFTWLFLGALQASIAFFFLYYTYGNHTPFVESNKMATKLGFAIVLFFAIVCAATMKLYFISKDPGYLFYLAAILSCVLLPIFFYVMSLFDLRKFFKDNTLYHEFLSFANSYSFWLAILATFVVTLIPDVILCLVDRYRYNRTLKSIIESKAN